jgi:hypothetical protein
MMKTTICCPLRPADTEMMAQQATVAMLKFALNRTRCTTCCAAVTIDLELVILRLMSLKAKVCRHVVDTLITISFVPGIICAHCVFLDSQFSRWFSAAENPA